VPVPSSRAPSGGSIYTREELTTKLLLAVSSGSANDVWRLLNRRAFIVDGARGTAPLGQGVGGRLSDSTTALFLPTVRSDGVRPHVEAAGPSGDTALHAACAAGYEDIVALLLRASAEAVHQRDAQGATPLHRCVSQGDVGILEQLIRAKADVNAVDGHGRTPLLVAIETHHGSERRSCSIATILVTAGAELNPPLTETAPLVHAVLHSRDGALVKHLVGLGASVNALDAVGVTALYNAVALKKPRVLEALLSMDASVHLRGRAGGTPGLTVAHLVALQGDEDVVQTLARQVGQRAVRERKAKRKTAPGAPPPVGPLAIPDLDGRLPLHFAAALGHTAALASLLEAESHAGSSRLNVDPTDALGRTPLMYALAAGHEDAVEILLDAGASYRKPDAEGNVPISVAAASGRADLVRDVGARLIAAGGLADVNRGNRADRTAAHVAASGENGAEVLEALLELGADLRMTDVEGRTALHVAAEEGFPDAAEVAARGLSDAGGDPWGEVDLLGRGPLALAARRGHAGVVQRLLDLGARRRDCALAQDLDRRTALSHAAVGGHVDCISLLLAASAAVDHRDYQGRTPLSLAAGEGHYEAARVLLGHGADAGSCDDDGQTPVHAAAVSGDVDVVELLLSSTRPESWSGGGSGKGISALVLAASEGQTGAALALIRLGGGLGVGNGVGEKARLAALANGHGGCARALAHELRARGMMS